jgi:CRP/FNR family transcriptional regulator
MSRHPVLALNIAKYLREQLDDALAVHEDVAYLKVSERLLKLFQRLAAEHGTPADGGGTKIDVRLTHADMASLIGSTRETVTVQMQQLVRDGAVRLDGRSIVLLGT